MRLLSVHREPPVLRRAKRELKLPVDQPPEPPESASESGSRTKRSSGSGSKSKSGSRSKSKSGSRSKSKSGSRNTKAGR
jgi:hypothetical protein